MNKKSTKTVKVIETKKNDTHIKKGKPLDKKKSSNEHELEPEPEPEPELENEMDIMESLLGSSQFNIPLKKKETIKFPKSKDIAIDMETDSPEQVIEKLVLGLNKLRQEFNEYRHYVEGTYCTSAEHNRTSTYNENKIVELAQRIDELTE
jgi:hypothetical protein